jgi:hypothetical protein
MRSIRRTLALVVCVLGLLASSSLASASVGDQLSKAASALDKAAAAAERLGDRAAFESHMKSAQKHTAKAERAARGAKGKARRAKLVRRVAAQYDANLDRNAGLIGRVPAALQAPVVESVATSAGARERVVGLLMRIAEGLPRSGEAKTFSAIAAFETDGDLEALIEAIASKGVLTSVKPAVVEQLNEISEHVNDVLARARGAGSAASMIQLHIGELYTLLDRRYFDGSVEAFQPGGLCDLLSFLPLPLRFCY